MIYAFFLLGGSPYSPSICSCPNPYVTFCNALWHHQQKVCPPLVYNHNCPLTLCGPTSESLDVPKNAQYKLTMLQDCSLTIILILLWTWNKLAREALDPPGMFCDTAQPNKGCQLGSACVRVWGEKIPDNLAAGVLLPMCAPQHLRLFVLFSIQLWRWL